MPDVKPQPKELVGIRDKTGTQINPAREDGNLAAIKAKIDNLDVPLSTRLKKEDLNLDSEKDLQVDVKTSPDTPILSLTQQDIRALLVILQHLVNSPLGRIRITTDGSVAISGSVSATQSGTWNLGNFPYSQYWELIQRANIEYNECQRSKFTFI